MGRKSLRSYKKRSCKKSSKRSCKKSSKRRKRSCKKSIKRRKRSCKKSIKRSYKFNLTIDGGVDNDDNTINFDVIYDFKLIELEGCGACNNAKKLIKDKGHTLDVKKELTNEEKEIIKERTHSKTLEIVLKKPSKKFLSEAKDTIKDNSIEFLFNKL